MNDKIFAEGIYFNERSAKNPAWLLGSLSIKKELFMKFLEDQNAVNGYVNLDIKRSAKGKVYIDLNTFIPKKQSVSADELNEMFNGEVVNPDTGEVVPF
jgi:hypothetical protein